MNKLLKYWLGVETIVSMVLYMGAASLLFADVVARELFNQPIWGAVRSAVFMANGAALIGISIAVAKGTHLRPNIFDYLPPPHLRRSIKRIGFLLSSIVMLGCTYLAVVFVLENRDLGFTAPPLDFPIWIAQLALPYGLCSAGLRYLTLVINPEGVVEAIT